MTIGGITMLRTVTDVGTVAREVVGVRETA